MQRRTESVVDQVAVAVFCGLGHVVYAIAVTLGWGAAFAVAYVHDDASLWVAVCAVFLVGWVLAAIWVPVRSVRDVMRYGCPIWGDYLRWRRRRARKRGNSWLRDSGLVHDTDSERKTDYRVWLWPHRLIIDSLPVVGVTADSVSDAIRRSLVAWDMADCDIRQTGNRSWDVRLYPVSRMETLRVGCTLSALPKVDVSPGHLRVRIGRSLDGDAWLDIAGVSGILLAGLPGTGKTAGADIIMSAMLSRPDLVDVHVLDGKGGGDWMWAKTYCASWSNDDSYDEALRVLHDVQDVMRERLRTNRERYGDSNFWHAFGQSLDARVICIMVDEIQNWTAPAVQDKETRAKAAEFIGLLTDIVKKGRSAGVCVVMATQKPSTDAIPSGLRDVCAKRFAFHVSTPEMARACLGIIPEGEPSPVDVAFADKGLAVTTTDSGGTAFVRFDYLPESFIEPLLNGVNAR